MYLPILLITFYNFYYITILIKIILYNTLLYIKALTVVFIETFRDYSFIFWIDRSAILTACNYASNLINKIIITNKKPSSTFTVNNYKTFYKVTISIIFVNRFISIVVSRRFNIINTPPPLSYRITQLNLNAKFNWHIIIIA